MGVRCVRWGEVDEMAINNTRGLGNKDQGILLVKQSAL